MLATMALVLGGFALLVRRAYRSAARADQPYRPEGKLRWTDDSVASSRET
jgi:hypothetical protein